MTPDGAVALLAEMLRVAFQVAGPLLLVALATGVVVGVVQAATQINEASLGFVVKVVALAGALVALGPTLASFTVTYARASLRAVEHVVR